MKLNITMTCETCGAEASVGTMTEAQRFASEHDGCIPDE